MTIREYIDANGLETKLDYDQDLQAPYVPRVAEALGIDGEDLLTWNIAAAVAVAVHQGRNADAEIAAIRELADSRDWADEYVFRAAVFARYGLEVA